MPIRRLIIGMITMVGLIPESKAQNLINNPSFETYFDCPKSRVYRQFGPFLPAWEVHETPDFFHLCSKEKSGVPSNFAGQLMPAGGDGYVGIIVNYGKLRYVEYLEQKLEEPLQKDQLYCCTYYCARAANARMATTPPRVSFGPFSLVNSSDWYGTGPKVPKKIEKQLAGAIEQFPLQDQIIEASDQWTWICQVYRGTGLEQYIRLGGKIPEGRPFERLEYENPSSVNGNAYYFIDEISLAPVNDISDCNCQEKRTLAIPIPEQTVPEGLPSNDPPKTDQTVVMQEVTFETNQATLLPTSFESIEQLLQLLLEFPDAQVQIAGHTDNTGNEAENVILSNNRAKAVADYLIEKGIHSERLHWKGYGSSVPIADNSTETGRQTNRRVEFKLFYP